MRIAAALVTLLCRHTPDPLLGTEGRWKDEANPYIGGDSVVGEIKVTDDNRRTTADDVKVQSYN